MRIALLAMLVINWTTVSKFNNLFTIIKALKINTGCGYPFKMHAFRIEWNYNFWLFSSLRLPLYIWYIKHG